jgi:hypothetical protein
MNRSRVFVAIVVASVATLVFALYTPPAFADPASTTTTVAANANPAQYGQSVTFTATLTVVSPGTGTPDGTVGFVDSVSNSTIATATLDANGQARATVTFTQLGNHDIRAIYSGSASYVKSISALLHEVVGRGNSAITLTASANPSTYGNWITFHATASAATPAVGRPTGFVTFTADNIELGTMPLTQRTAAFVTTFVGGVHHVVASYSGDANFLPSTSAQFNETVAKIATKETLITAKTPVPKGTAATFTATLTSTVSTAGVLTGFVQFKDGTTALGPAVAVGPLAKAILKVVLVPGTHTITATYLGDMNFKASVATVTQTVSSS